jgi:hypothetical protein
MKSGLAGLVCNFLERLIDRLQHLTVTKLHNAQHLMFNAAHITSSNGGIAQHSVSINCPSSITGAQNTTDSDPTKRWCGRRLPFFLLRSRRFLFELGGAFLL